jgi:outer membrane protein
MKRYLTILFAALLLTAGVASAQQLSIAVIDVERLRDESAIGKEARARVGKAFEDRQAQFKKSADDLEALRKQLTTQRATLTEARVTELAKQIEDGQVALERFQKDAQQDLAEMQRKEQEAFERQVMPLINELGRELKLQMIFNKFQSGLVFADESVDITDQVLKRLNTRVTE